MLRAIDAPWTVPLSTGQHQLISYFLVVAGLALLAAFLRAVVTRNEVGARFRGAVIARLCVTGVAFLSYSAIVVAFSTGYERSGGMWLPRDGAVETFSLRYSDWTITVPFLVIELLAVTTLAGVAARRTRWFAMATAALMIFTGFLGGIVIGGGESIPALVIWGLISCVFWVITTVVLIRAVRISLPELTPEAAALLGKATILLLGGWVIYPLIYLIQIVASGGEWTTTMHVAFCLADITVKLGFGELIHRVAKLRTAEDVRAGDDVHPEAIWISSIKQSDAGTPREVYLARGAEVHSARSRPPATSAVPASSDADAVTIDPADSDL